MTVKAGSNPGGASNFPVHFDHFVRRWNKRTLCRWTAVDYRPCVGEAFAFRNLTTPKPLAVRALKRGGGFQRTSTPVSRSG
jgi:hypothetical protein